jgi:hypothetical protein
VRKGTTPDECVEFCVGMDAIKAAEKLFVDLRTGEVKGTIFPKLVTDQECDEFMKEPSRFAEWCVREKKEQKVASDVWIITLNCLTAMLSTFGLARIVAPHGQSTDEIVASLDSIVHILRDLGTGIVKCFERYDRGHLIGVRHMV